MIVGELARESRRPRGGLLLGMLVAGPLFVWLFLRPGYAVSTRIAAFSYAAVMLAFGLIHAIG